MATVNAKSVAVGERMPPPSAGVQRGGQCVYVCHEPGETRDYNLAQAIQLAP